MEIRTLRYFLAVAREENMTRAAEILHVTQPTLSKQLKSLEDELGKKLFTRHSFSIKLTEEGLLLKNRAEDLVSMADKIENEFTALDDITGGDLYFGLAESFRIRLLARELNKFKQKYPGLHYFITSGDTEQVSEKLDKGLLDFAVFAQTPDSSKYESLLFPESDIWGVVMPADSDLAHYKSIKPKDLIGIPLFCSGQGWEHDISHWAGKYIDQYHLEGTFKLSYNASLFAKENLGYLLTFDKIVDTSKESGLVFRPLDPTLETNLYLVWKKHPAFSPIAGRFLDQIRESFEKYK